MAKVSLKQLYIRWQEDLKPYEDSFDLADLWYAVGEPEPELDENGNSPGFTYGFFN